MSQTPAMVILKILTPSSIITMTSSAKRQNRVSLTKMLLKRDFATPFEEGEDELPPSPQPPKAEGEGKEAEIEGGAPTSAQAEGEQPGEESSGSVSIFLLEQKRKFRQTEMKLKKRELLSLYQSSAAVDISHEDVEGESISSDTQFGTLLDKKQS